eukprot:2805067-Lingulodinium_polyedra.AAC.1
MTSSSRCFAVATTRKPRARALHARNEKSVRAWSAFACDLRTAAAAKRRFNCIIAHVSQNAAQ